jgi:DNA-binding transcriptional LysR family regulator
MAREVQIDIEDMILFYHVAEKGGFYKAAEALGISQPKVSRRISKLEEYFGTHLLHRGVKGIAMTESGELVLNMSRAIVENVHAVRQQVQTSQTEPEGKIVLATPPGFGQTALMPLLWEFADLYPDIRLVIKDNKADNADLMLGEADIVLSSFCPQNRESLECRLLCEYHNPMYASRVYLDKRGMPEKASDLDHHDLVVSNSPHIAAGHSPWMALGILGLGRSQGVPLRVPRLHTNSDVLTFAAVVQHMGIALMPTFFAETAPHLVRIPFFDKEPDFAKTLNRKYVVYPKPLTQSRRHMALVDWMIGKAARFV